MVSQDFLLACARLIPEDDPEFVEAIRVEFTAAIKSVAQPPEPRVLVRRQ